MILALIIILCVIVYFFITDKQDKKDFNNDTKYNSRWVKVFDKKKKK